MKRYREYVEQGLAPDMEDWGLGEKSVLSMGDSGFRDWVQDRHAELVSAVKHKEGVAFRPVETVLPPAAILAKLAEQMACTSALSGVCGVTSRQSTL